MMSNSMIPGLQKGHIIWQVQSESTEYIEPVWEATGPELEASVHDDDSRASASKLLKGKGRETKPARGTTGPLHLLDLPVDILRLITKEVTQTSDLTSLALSCSTLYNLAVPHIYARFDIVWPESNAVASDSVNVDALTYGLSTLCLGSKFAQRTRWLKGGAAESGSGSQRLLDSQYAKYTRKFGLGNGPAKWVSEYDIKKESGKMLGTLVALAISKMINLESFTWDMPTGILSDVFMALASLQDHDPVGRPKLERVHVRWHDNDPAYSTASSLSSPVMPPTLPPTLPPPPPPPGPLAQAVQASSATLLRDVPRPKYSESRVEYPTLSILPPLRYLSVLDIDELAYIDEMSILVGKSKDTLQELRVGIAQKVSNSDFNSTWEGDNLQQVDLTARWPGESVIGDKRLGGVLGVIVGRIYEIRQKGQLRSNRYSSGSISPITDDNPTHLMTPTSSAQDDGLDLNGTAPGQSKPTSIGNTNASAKVKSAASSAVSGSSGSQQNHNLVSDSSRERKRLDGKLRLHTLELERVALSMQVCFRAFDWSVLTNLTILSCNQHENLWKVLKRRFQPTPPSRGSTAATQYHLVLKKLHTDFTTHALMSFIKETLEPNTLEVLFLQDRRRASPQTVSIETIFKVAVKRHRSSLRKLLIDSNDKLGRDSRSEGSRWKQWVLPSEMVAYVTSGRMSALGELAVALHFRDWHSFLQRLPNIPQLRSLHVPHIQEHISGSFEPKELALQLVDIITLRPEVKLCYIGIRNKCFEILECSPRSGIGIDGNFGADSNSLSHPHQNDGAISIITIGEDHDGSNNSDADETEDEDDDAGSTGSTPTDGEDDDFTEVSEDGISDNDNFDESHQTHLGTRLRLREILFYDDKVAIFKARHGRL